MKMDKEKLKKLVREFEKSREWVEYKTPDPDALHFRKGEYEELIYIYDKDEDREKNLGKILGDLGKKYPRVIHKFLLPVKPLDPKLKGIIGQNDFTYKAPVNFFDKELVKKESSKLKDIEEEIKKYENERIEQPFSNGKEGKDLLDQLLNELDDIDQPYLRVIVAPAGYGKTVLMYSLYSELRKKFYDIKKKEKLARRPILMFSGHVEKANNLDELINNFIWSEYIFGEVKAQTFKFWVNNDFVIWLLDGVEELILRNPGGIVYDLLNDYISFPGEGNPQIIIAIRESIYELPDFKNEIEDWKDFIKVYKLTEWNKRSIASYIDKNLKEEKERERFKREIEGSETLMSLCKVPYFCSLIVDLKNNNQLGIFENKFELVKEAFKKYCEREYAKGLDKEIFPIEEQLEIMIYIVGEMLMERKIKRKEVEDLLEEHYLKDFDEDEKIKDEKIKQKNAFLRHALLKVVGDGDIEISHEIMKQYLEGEYILKYISKSEVPYILKNKEIIEYNSFLLEFLVNNLHNDINWEQIIEQIQATHPKAFRNILKILLESNYNNKEQVIKNYLHGRNLRGIRFKNLNMKSFNFSNSDLEGTLFENCDLTGACFDHCIIKDTIFKDCKLDKASTKAIQAFSIEINGKRYEGVDKIRDELSKITGTPPDRKGPCQAVIDFKATLEKLTRRHRRHQVRKDWLSGGNYKKLNVIDACFKEDILTQNGEYVKIKIDSYDEVKRFIENPSQQTLTPKIKRTLDRLCENENCNHI